MAMSVRNSAPQSDPKPGRAPLEGIRVLDLGTVYAAPISAMLLTSRVRTDGSSAAITGISKSPISAVKTTSTATSVSLKKRSTRYLSRCVEMAHKTGPENAKTSQLMRSCLRRVCPAPPLSIGRWPGRLFARHGRRNDGLLSIIDLQHPNGQELCRHFPPLT